MSTQLDDTGEFRWLAPAVPEPTARPLELRLKHGLEQALAAVLLAVTAPILLAIMALIRLTSRGPALFVQDRIGHRCQVFRMYKLRTMIQGAEAMEDGLRDEQPGRRFFKLEDDPRVTRVGRWLRRTSLDELPQLINVLKGEMSLVGPRPLLLSDGHRFPRGQQLRRFSMRPGITGLWQVSGRSLTTDEERLRLDLEYVDRWSLGMDLGILLRTIPVVLSGRGAT
ncbi:MAG: sugar transferase [Thermoanaerobaculia bacterium]|nr:sugar transferase [Thermoanaerobaculia bacterium]